MIRRLLLVFILIQAIFHVPGCAPRIPGEGTKSGEKLSDTAANGGEILSCGKGTPGEGAADLPKGLKNSLGMELILIPAGDFRMGNEEPVAELLEAFPYTERREIENAEPSRPVRISKPFYMGKYEVTVGQFRSFVEASGYRAEAEQDGEGGVGYDETKFTIEMKPNFGWLKTGFAQTESHPVTNVSWNDARAFCAWLSKEDGAEYRLPTEAEWEYACRGGTSTRYHSGEDPERLVQVGNIADGTGNSRFYFSISRKGLYAFQSPISANDGYIFTAPVGRFRANAFGLYDMHGNVWEWCSDLYGADYYKNGPKADPTGPREGSSRIFRGGGWASAATGCRSAFRNKSGPSSRHVSIGFRVAHTTKSLVPASSTKSIQGEASSDAAISTATKDRPKPVRASELGSHAGDERSDKALGLKLAWCPAGKFLMGSPASDPDAKDDEQPQVAVELTRGFWLGKYEVTQGEWQGLMGTAPWKVTGSAVQGANYPACEITLAEAVEFCEKLTEREMAAGSLTDGWYFRLPSEAEWEYACRAGSQTRYSFGDAAEELGKYAFYKAGPSFELRPVGEKAANRWGFFDMHGNVSEWCRGWYGEKLPGGRNPLKPFEGVARTFRGGSNCDEAGECRSASRNSNFDFRSPALGLRVALVPSSQ